MNEFCFRVSWSQGHEVEVRARNKEDAKTISTWMDDKYTLKCIRNLSARRVRA